MDITTQSQIKVSNKDQIRYFRMDSVIAIILLLALWLPHLVTLSSIWKSDPALSYGFLIPFITCYMVWTRKSDIRLDMVDWKGLPLLLLSGILYSVGIWSDIEFITTLSLILLLLGAILYLGGNESFNTLMGPVCFLVFMTPWPTTIIEHIGFPLQMASSAYAALFAGLLGIPVQRDGVQLSIVPHLNSPPIYVVAVAQQCSGLSSLLVLLALGYLIAMYIPVRLWIRSIIVAITIPMALIFNAIRLTIVLIAGANHKPQLAQWIHDHEQPVLIFICTIILLIIRQLIIDKYLHNTENNEYEYA